MQHALYPSVAAMLAPDTLSEIAGQPISTVARLPFESRAFGASGSRLEAVHTNGGDGPRYVVKLMSLEWDGIMRATADGICRSVAIWQHGLLDQLPAGINHAIVAAAHDGPGYALLMRDVSDALYSQESAISSDDNQRFLQALAALHTAFWESPLLNNPALGFCSLHHYYSALASRTDSEIGTFSEVLHYLQQGWELLDELIAPDVAALVRELHEDPRPLCDALSRYPYTLMHGDPRRANIGIMRGTQPQVVLLDWHWVGRAPPAADLAWYIGLNWPSMPIDRDAAIAYYRDALARSLGGRFALDWWEPQLALGLLGFFVQLGSRDMLAAVGRWGDEDDGAQRALFRAALDWWTERIRDGARWLA